MSLRADAPAGGARSRASESSPAGFTPGMVLCSRYRLARIVGSGGMATVWRAHDEHLGRPVAVKVMSDSLAADPDYVARFEREARTAARVWHANLVQIYDYSVSGGRPFLVMEFLGGGTLQQRLRHGPLSPDALHRLADELLSAIASVHRSGVLHRDIKPANVLFDGSDRAHLTDFGIARMEFDSGLTLPGQMLGTLRFLAPELLQGASASRRSDLYSLGILLREVPVSGRADPVMSELIDRLADPRPERRPVDAEEALSLLRATRADGQPTQELGALPAATAATAATAVAPLRAPGLGGRRARAAGGLSLRRGLAAAVACLAIVVALVALTSGGSPGRAVGRTSAHRRPAPQVSKVRATTTKVTPALSAPAPAPPPPGPGAGPDPGKHHGKGHDAGPPPGHKRHGGGEKD